MRLTLNDNLFRKGLHRRLAGLLGASIVLALASTALAGVDSISHLKLVRTVSLRKPAGRVDQIIPLKDGSWVVRDADFFKPETQSMEIYGPEGGLVRKISEFGRGPGKYYRFRGLDVAADSTLWEADLTRLNLFRPDGGLRETVLIQKPGYQLFGLALDEERGFFYVAGCVPIHTYLNDGCRLLHQYRISDHRLEKSLLETDELALKNNWLPLEWYSIDVDPTGSVYLIDAPVHKLFKVDPREGKVEDFAIVSRLMKPAPLLFPMNTASHDQAYREGFLLDRVLAVGGKVFISVRKPNWEGYLLQVFDQSGRQIASDIEAPGRLVGKTKADSLLFARPDAAKREIEILEYIY